MENYWHQNHTLRTETQSESLEIKRLEKSIIPVKIFDYLSIFESMQFQQAPISPLFLSEKWFVCFIDIELQLKIMSCIQSFIAGARRISLRLTWPN